MKYFVLLLFLFSVSSFSFENNNFTSNDKQRLFIKAFDDIVFHNRTRISRISQLAEKLGWKEIKTKDATKAYSYWGIKEYLYKDYTIRIKSDYEEEIFAIYVNNDDEYFGYELANILLKTYPPIGKIYDENSYRKEVSKLFYDPLTKEVSTNYQRIWFIEGGYEIKVCLFDLDYHKIKSKEKRKTAIIILSRF